MSWIRGTATDYLDLSDEIVAAATGSSVQTVGISSGGTGYVVGDILSVAGGTGTVTAQIEVTSVSAGVIDGVRVYNGGVYTVNPSTPNSVTGGTGSGASLTLTFSSNGWTADRDTTWSGSEKEVIMHGSGGGSDAIYAGWRTFSGSGYYNFELHGFTGYDSGLDHDEQPGVSPGFHDATLTVNEAGAYLLSHNSSISYWMNVNAYRIILFTKAGSAYFNSYLGFGNRFGTTSEYPYPMLVSGVTSNPTDPSTQTKLSSGLTDPWADSGRPDGGPMFVMNTDNQWYQVKNGTVSLGSRTAARDVCVIPCQYPDGVTDSGTPPEDKFMGSGTGDLKFDQIIPSGNVLGGNPTYNTEKTPGTTDAHIMLPATVVMSTPSKQVLMELDEIFWVSSFGTMATEDRIIVGSDVYRVFQNCNRTDPYAFLAVKEA